MFARKAAVFGSIGSELDSLQSIRRYRLISVSTATSNLDQASERNETQLCANGATFL